MTPKAALCVELVRGGMVESSHLVDAVVVDAEGAIVRAHGDCERMVFPRSSIKALQALPLLESGAADAFGFQPKHIALACASHNGEEFHEETALEMLALAGLSDTCLECGTQLPSLPQTLVELTKAGKQASAVHNNCSGKHAGFLAFAKHAGFATRGYINIAHPVQREIAGVLEAVTGATHGEEQFGIDGCSIPTYPVAMKQLAYAFAKFGVAMDESRTRSNAMTRIRDACLAHPEMVGGTDRVCTRLMKALSTRAFVKVGAEGVYTASLPETGFGIAMKARDGNPRAVEVAIAGLITDLLRLEGIELDQMMHLLKPELKNWNSITTGHMQLAERP
ncbi:MAG: asparaginase [Pseudomonadota bacterium]